MVLVDYMKYSGLHHGCSASTNTMGNIDYNGQHSAILSTSRPIQLALCQ